MLLTIQSSYSSTWNIWDVVLFHPVIVQNGEWNEMKKKTSNRRNLNNFLPEYCTFLVDTIPKRIKAVIDAKGNVTPD